MPRYIDRAIARFKHSVTPFPQQSLQTIICPNYGSKTQFNPPPDKSNNLNAKRKIHIQEIVCIMLYHARGVNLTLLVVLTTIGSQQVKPAENTAAALNHLLNYTGTHPDTTIEFYIFILAQVIYPKLARGQGPADYSSMANFQHTQINLPTFNLILSPPTEQLHSLHNHQELARASHRT